MLGRIIAMSLKKFVNLTQMFLISKNSYEYIRIPHHDAFSFNLHPGISLAGVCDMLHNVDHILQSVGCLKLFVSKFI